MIEILSCGHRGSFTPDPRPTDMQLFCRRCMKWVDRNEKPAIVEEWWIRCTMCRLSKRYGADERRAQRQARLHAWRRKHVVNIKRGKKIVDTVDPGAGMVPLIVTKS